MTTKQDQESFSSKKDLLDLLAQRKEEERQVRDADGGDDACESVASKVFLGSPLCLFLCADEETRRSYLERYASTVATYEELEGIVDPFQVMSMATFMSGWGTCGGNLMYKFPIFTVVAAVGYVLHIACYSITQGVTATWLLLMLDGIVIHLYHYVALVMSYCHETTRNFSDAIADPEERLAVLDPSSWVSVAHIEMTLGLASEEAPLPAAGQREEQEEAGGSQGIVLHLNLNTSEIWNRSLVGRGSLTVASVAWIGVFAAWTWSGLFSDIAHSVHTLTAQYSTPPFFAVLEIVMSCLAFVHLVQITACHYASTFRMFMMNFDVCVCTHHVTSLLRIAKFKSLRDTVSYASLSVVALLSFLHCASLTHLRIIKQRIFTHLLRRLLNLVRDRTNLYSRKVVLFLDVNTVFNTLAVSFAATSWASGSPNGCVPVWLSWSAGGVLMTQVAYYTAAGIVNIFLRRLTPLIKEKQLEATKQRKRQPFEQEKISRKSFALCRLLQVCADVDKLVASYHGVAVTPHGVAYLLSETAVFAFALIQITSYAHPTLFTSRFLVCDSNAHHLPWPAPDLVTASSNSSNSTLLLGNKTK